jgi:hypothetical protein
MTPTNELRFVEREVFGDDKWERKTIRVLQQKWTNNAPRWDVEKQMIVPDEQWRDVPLEKEET